MIFFKNRLHENNPFIVFDIIHLRIITYTIIERNTKLYVIFQINLSNCRKRRLTYRDPN